MKEKKDKGDLIKITIPAPQKLPLQYEETSYRLGGSVHKTYNSSQFQKIQKNGQKI